MGLEGLVESVAVLRLDLLGKLTLAAVLGGLIGAEREWSGKPAGLRTNLLICVGAALLGDLSLHYAADTLGAEHVRADPGRIAAQVVTGVGFLGAGTILQSRGNVIGLTTAATIWVVAAIGLAVGGGALVAAVGTTILVLVVLLPLAYFERWIEGRRTRARSFRVRVEGRPGPIDEIESVFSELGLDPHLRSIRLDDGEETVVVTFSGEADDERVRTARTALLGIDGVRELVVLEVPTA